MNCSLLKNLEVREVDNRITNRHEIWIQQGRRIIAKCPRFKFDRFGRKFHITWWQ